MKRMLKVAILCILSVTLCSGCSKSAKYNYESAVTELNNESYQEADGYIQSALENEPGNAEYLICSGMINIGLGKYDEAVTIFDKVITTDGNMNAIENNKNAYRGKGIAYMKLKMYSEAADSFKQALDCKALEDIDMDILKYRADCLVKAEDYENGLAACEAILAKTPNDIKILNLVCTCCAKTGATDKAKQYLDKVTSLSKGSGAKDEFYADITTGLINAGEYKQAAAMIAELGTISNSEYKKVLMYNEIVALEGQLDFNNAYVKAKAYMAVYADDANMKRELQFLETRISQ